MSKTVIRVALLGLVVVGGLMVRLDANQARVVRRPYGFFPKSLRVRVGTTILFENKTTQRIWPASNFHPTHTLYKEFDARDMIAAGGR